MRKMHSLQEFMRVNQTQSLNRFLRSRRGLPAGVKDVKTTANALLATVKPFGRRAFSLTIGKELPRLYVDPRYPQYRTLCLDFYREEDLIEQSSVWSVVDFDHALAKSLAEKHFEYVLMNPVTSTVNRSFGSFEKGSKERVFHDPLVEFASITEILRNSAKLRL